MALLRLTQSNAGVDRYRVEVALERSGFARQTFGALSPAGEGTALALTAGQQLSQIIFRLVPQGAVAGRVVDAKTGSPIGEANLSVPDKGIFYPANNQGEFLVIDKAINKSDSISFSCVGNPRPTKTMSGAAAFSDRALAAGSNRRREHR